MYFDELEIGMSVDTAPVLIEKEKLLSFARDYDNLPLHTDEEYAKNGLVEISFEDTIKTESLYLQTLRKLSLNVRYDLSDPVQKQS